MSDYDEYKRDKIHKHTPIMDCLSECCGASCNSDYMICMDCGEHCEIYYEDDTDEDTKDECNRKK
tara:strand:+ start:50 stop:244 length:195 start_codon:yes stop_codon:yes gene_type:complete